MDNVWFNPKGYQRTSQKIQKICMDRLLSFGSIHGRILDVGCGTGHLLPLTVDADISCYLGVDISPEMIDFARAHHKGEKFCFEVCDFLEWDRSEDEYFDTVVCAACLHWFIPNERAVINKIFEALNVGGTLFLSCAGNFEFLRGERELHTETLSQIRKKYHAISSPIIFDDFRFTPEKLIDLLDGFEFLKIDRIEEKIDFRNFDDFRDWHLGSGSVIYQQFAQHNRECAVNDYYERLYRAYSTGTHDVSYSTMLLRLRKRA